MLIKNVPNLKTAKFIFAMVLWAVFSTSFYFGLLDSGFENNLEMSLLMGLALAVLVLHLIKILKQVAYQSL